MKIRFEIPATRETYDFEMKSVPREGETVYLKPQGGGMIRRLFLVRHVCWYPDGGPDFDFDAYIVLRRPTK